jgi:alpha-aminoadipic semialdehyde synthase
VLSGAIIAKDGKLTDPHKNLYDSLPKLPKNDRSKLPSKTTTKYRKDKKNILLLGSGFVAKPFVDYLRKRDLSLTIGKLQDVRRKKVL